MCKFCKTEPFNKSVNEEILTKRIMGIKDGSQSFDLYFNRYIVKDEGIRTSSLELNLDVFIDNGMYNVKTKRIDIKYCPFCGEEL